MNTIAEFTVIGRVGEIKQVGSTLRVSVASSFSRRDGCGAKIGSKAYLTAQQLCDESDRHVKCG